MSVNSVDNRNNNAAIIAGSAIAGGAGSALGGYYTKPWLKDGMPTDSFVKGIKENMMKDLPADIKNAVETLESMTQAIKNSKTVEDFNKIEIDSALKVGKGKTLEEFKEILKTGAYQAYNEGWATEEDFNKYISALDEVKDLDELKIVIKESAERMNSGKTIEQLKARYTEQMAQMKELFGFSSADEVAKLMFNEAYDSSTKKLVKSNDITEEAFKAVKKAADSIQGKAALMWGAIGAAVLGLGAYAVTAMTSKKQTPQPEIDTKTPELAKETNA